MTPAQFQEAGLYDPDSPGAETRLELLRWLEARGVSLERMQEAAARGQLAYVASMSVLRPGPYLSQQQLSERLGVPIEVLEAFRVAFALPPVPPGEPWCNESEARMFESVAGGVELFGMRDMLRLARVLGSSTSRVAEAMVAANRERMGSLLGEDATELEVAQAITVASGTADAPSKIMAGLLSIHVQLAGNRVRERREHFAADTMRGCVGFVDIVGSTTLSRRLSTRDLAQVVDRFEEVSHAIATNLGGRVVKFIGDEVMFVTGSSASACEIALSMIEAFAGDASVTPRAGLAEGELLDRGGDYYGPVVNLAARLAELAVPSEVLVTTEVVRNLDGTGMRCESAGRRLLRGFDEPVQLMTVSRA